RAADTPANADLRQGRRGAGTPGDGGRRELRGHAAAPRLEVLRQRRPGARPDALRRVGVTLLAVALALHPRLRAPDVLRAAARVGRAARLLVLVIPGRRLTTSAGPPWPSDAHRSGLEAG